MCGAFLENGGGGTMVRFLGGIVIGSMSSPFYQYVGPKHVVVRTLIVIIEVI